MSKLHQPALADRALASFAAALGEARLDKVGARQQHYWAIPRHKRPTLNVYLTIEAAESGQVVHLTIGDPCRRGDDAVVSTILHSNNQVAASLDDIRGRMVCE